MNDLIVLALKDEAPTLFSKYKNVFEIGVGKVNAAINTTKLIAEHKPKRIFNFGTAGGITVGTGIYRINRVHQHDVNLMAIGHHPGQHLHDNMSFITLPGNGKICASGDLFVTDTSRLRIACDIIEMEAYSIAKAAITMGVEVEIHKFITDLADENAGGDWKKHVASGEMLYQHVLNQLNAQLEEI